MDDLAGFTHHPANLLHGSLFLKLPFTRPSTNEKIRSLSAVFFGCELRPAEMPRPR